MKYLTYSMEFNIPKKKKKSPLIIQIPLSSGGSGVCTIGLPNPKSLSDKQRCALIKWLDGTLEIIRIQHVK